MHFDVVVPFVPTEVQTSTSDGVGTGITVVLGSKDSNSTAIDISSSVSVSSANEATVERNVEVKDEPQGYEVATVDTNELVVPVIKAS